ncbi:probable xyloglucan endotransglucosylase/hydrolase protein 26 [Tanacetum coccineum]
MDTRLSSTGAKHDEIDFEFLGNSTGEPYTVHTNIFTQGQGNREQQFQLWFDPTANYHNYTIHWNPTEVVWYVDSIPIRVFKNYQSQRIAYPNQQGMKVYSSLWNADNWATRGGLVKIDWTAAPFVANYRRFRARACKWDGPVSISQCAIPTRANWWTSPVYKQLTMSQQGNGDDVRLVLDQTSGSGIQSKRAFLFGSIEMLIKLVPGNSAGTVTAYYLSSTGAKHDEIDFEFLGNSTGEPYTVHTNIFTQGQGNREQQFKLWFDPTANYHNYTIHWNPTEVVWYVDSVPIRVFRNYQSQGIAYPNQQGMRVYSSLWNADNWATRGGLVKIDWTAAPFVANYRRFRARACKWNGPVSISQCAIPTRANWWTSNAYKQLTVSQQGQLKWVRDNRMIYNYCTDYKRFKGQMPPECSKPQY